MTSSIVRNQTVAAVSYGFANAAYDFGGGNQLSVESGFALEDARVSPLFTEPIPAAGILLNGRPQSGLVRGPLEQPPDLRIDDPRSAIQF